VDDIDVAGVDVGASAIAALGSIKDEVHLESGAGPPTSCTPDRDVFAVLVLKVFARSAVNGVACSRFSRAVEWSRRRGRAAGGHLDDRQEGGSSQTALRRRSAPHHRKLRINEVLDTSDTTTIHIMRNGRLWTLTERGPASSLFGDAVLTISPG
jgi:hypothetical protein